LSAPARVLVPTSLPSADRATPLTGPPALMRQISLPEGNAVTMTSPSSPDDTSVLPSADQATPSTGPPCFTSTIGGSPRSEPPARSPVSASTQLILRCTVFFPPKCDLSYLMRILRPAKRKIL